MGHKGSLSSPSTRSVSRLKYFARKRDSPWRVKKHC